MLVLGTDSSSSSSLSDEISGFLQVGDVEKPEGRKVSEEPETEIAIKPSEGVEKREYVELNKEREWFPSKTNIVQTTHVYSYFEKVIFEELPDKPPITPKLVYHNEERFFYRKRKLKADEQEKLEEERKIRREKHREERKKECDLDLQLIKEAEEIGFHKRFPRFYKEPDTCKCGVKEHPPEWSDFMITKIHDNIYRINYEGLTIDKHVCVSVSETLSFIEVLTGERNPWSQKLRQLLIYIDIELGYYEGLIHQPSNRRVFLALDKVDIIGCVITEPISKGFRIISPLGPFPKVGKAIHATCGINRIWVLLKYRRKLLATALIDIVRFNFIAGRILGYDEVAFANPSSVGRHFAASYCKKIDFAIYNPSCY